MEQRAGVWETHQAVLFNKLLHWISAWICEEGTGEEVFILCADILSLAWPKYQEGLILRLCVLILIWTMEKVKASRIMGNHYA